MQVQNPNPIAEKIENFILNTDPTVIEKFKQTKPGQLGMKSVKLSDPLKDKAKTFSTVYADTSMTDMNRKIIDKNITRLIGESFLTNIKTLLNASSPEDPENAKRIKQKQEEERALQQVHQEIEFAKKQQDIYDCVSFFNLDMLRVKTTFIQNHNEHTINPHAVLDVDNPRDAEHIDSPLAEATRHGTQIDMGRGASMFIPEGATDHRTLSRIKCGTISKSRFNGFSMIAGGASEINMRDQYSTYDEIREFCDYLNQVEFPVDDEDTRSRVENQKLIIEFDNSDLFLVITFNKTDKHIKVFSTTNNIPHLKFCTIQLFLPSPNYLGVILSNIFSQAPVFIQQGDILKREKKTTLTTQTLYQYELMKVIGKEDDEKAVDQLQGIFELMKKHHFRYDEGKWIPFFLRRRRSDNGPELN